MQTQKGIPYEKFLIFLPFMDTFLSTLKPGIYNITVCVIISCENYTVIINPFGKSWQMYNLNRFLKKRNDSKLFVKRTSRS